MYGCFISFQEITLTVYIAAQYENEGVQGAIRRCLDADKPDHFIRTPDGCFDLPCCTLSGRTARLQCILGLHIDVQLPGLPIYNLAR